MCAFSLLVLALTAEAHAQAVQNPWPCAPGATEVLYDTPGDTQRVELWAVTPSGNEFKGSWLTDDPSVAEGDCAWSLDTNGDTQHTNAVIDPGDVGVIRICESGTCPPLGTSSDHEYTLFHCGISPSSTPGYGFFCGPTGAAGNGSQDILIADNAAPGCQGSPFATGTFHIEQVGSYPCLSLEDQGFGQGKGLPYHVATDPNDAIHLFFVKQAAYRHADGTHRFRLTSSGFTLLSGHTYTWDLPEGVVEFTRSPQLTVNGTLDVDGMTLTSYELPPPVGEQPASWAGIRVTSDSTLRATGPLTLQGTTDGNLSPAPIDFEGTLEVAAGGALHLEGDLDVTLHNDLVVEAGGLLTIDPGTTLRFKPGTGLVVKGRIDADGTSFVEADAGQGWEGLAIIRPAGESAAPPNTLHACDVWDVTAPPGSRVIRGAVHVVNREVVVSGGSEIAGSDDGVIGLFASGPAADVTITDGSLVYENDGGGVLASSGATVLIEQGSQVFRNPGGGVAAKGYGSTLTLDGVTVRDHDGPGSAEAPGVRALTDGQVLFNNVDVSGEVSVLNNDGGLDAQGGGSLDAGDCPGGALPCPNRNQHLISGNAQGGAFFDARSQSGSTLYAQGNDWDVLDVAQLVLVEDGTSCLQVCPLLGDDCEPAPCSGTVGGSRLAGDLRPDGAGDGSGRGGADVMALVDAAERARLDGDAAAFEIAADAVVAALASEEEGDRRAAFEGAVRLFAGAQPAGPLASLESLAGEPGDGRPWALRALGVARASAEDHDLARAAADTLAAAYAGTEHARFGLGLAVRAAVAEEEEAGAVAALLALAAGFPEAEEVGALAALVVGVFPAADLTGLEGRLAPSATASATASVTAEAAEGVLLRVEEARPNPAIGGATVPFVLMEAAEVEAVLYDTVGRRVAVLASGRYGAGVHALALAAERLPAGVYVVHVVARSTSGTATAVRRITLTR